MIVGVAGHIDHGKTALVGALTGVDTDRLKEEKARGISIDLGFAYLPTDFGVIGFVDVPGHERFIHTMVAGASGVDLALLVVAADDGVMQQTREHLALLDLLGVSRGVVALSKADIADDQRRAEVAEEIRSLVAETSLRGAPVIPVSAISGEGVESLRAALVDEAAQFVARSADDRFRLAVDRSFTLAGAGTVVTGTVLSGRIRVDEHAVVSPSGLPVRVRSIHAQNRKSEEGRAGDRCALNLAGEAVSKDAIRRGDMVIAPALHAPTDRIDATLRVLATEPKPLGQWFPARLHHASTDVGARIAPLSSETAAPGEIGFVQLVLERPIAAAAGDRYVVRDTSAQRTIGGGVFLDLRAPARKRRTPLRLAQIAALAGGDAATVLKGLLALEPWHVDLDAFVRDRALGSHAAADLAAKLALVTIVADGALIGMTRERWESYRAALLDELARFHDSNPDLAGMGVEKLRLALIPRLPKPIFSAALKSLAAAGVLALDGAWARIAGHEARLTEQDERLWLQIEPLLSGAARFRPPRVRDIASSTGTPEPDVRRLMKLLGRMGKVDEAAHDHFFLRQTVTDMVRLAAELSEAASDRRFAAAAFRDRVEAAGEPVGRKVAIQMLEFLDRHGVTLRRGDLRRINPHRLDLFGAIDQNSAPAGAGYGREASLVGRPDFKSGRGREPVPGGFDSHSLPPPVGGSSPKRQDSA